MAGPEHGERDPGPPWEASEEPAPEEPADFNGHFKTQDGKYCYPLTVTDPYSRRLLACRALPSPRTKGTMASLPTTPAT